VHAGARHALRPEQVVRGGIALTGAGFAALVAGHLLNELVLDKRYWHLDADVDGNALTVASAAATLAASLGAFLLARYAPHHRRRLVGAAAVLAFVAVDDVAAIHEDLGASLTHVGLPDIAGIWFPLYLPMLAATAAVLWSAARSLPVALPCVRVALLLLAAAIAGEVLAAASLEAIHRGNESLGYELEVALEEAAELAGWTLIATGLSAAVAMLRPERAPAQARVIQPV
jgi:hypothetical protein